MTTPKSIKQRKVIPIIPDIEEVELDDIVLQVIPNSQPEVDAINQPEVEIVKNKDTGPEVGVEEANSSSSSSSDDDEEVLSPEEEERLRIWDMFAEEYHDIIAELPLEYQRNFTLLEELEQTQQGSINSLKSALESYVTSISTSNASYTSPMASTSSAEPEGPTDAARNILANIGKSTRAAIRAGEDKVGLAVTLYEAVDRHIRRLDADLAKYEDSLVIGLRPGTLPSHDAPSLSLKSPPGRTTSRVAIAFGEREAYGEEELTGKRRGRGGGGGSDADKKREKAELKMERKAREAEERERNMTVLDPTEPTYCYCYRVSFGEMIGCENDNCAREWFHLECVGLSEPPLGTWYCTQCAKTLGEGTPSRKPGPKKGSKRVKL